MKIKNIDIEKLRPYKNNPRKHSESQIEQIANSINEFGFVNPIIADENNMILAGHGRFLAANKLLLTEVPVVQITDLDEKQKKALVIADNKIAMNSDWNEDLLWQQIQELSKDGFDLSLLAFNDMEIMPMIDSNTVIDPLKEWEDMPEFTEDSKTAFRSLIVHFTCQEDIDQFSELVEQTFTDKTKFMWYPEQQNMDTESKRYD
jgi:hypothetical protein|tara:strand:+ start:934 stop:1545 length:612 start_codon:yes stop_codon:yes gene_type:complete